MCTSFAGVVLGLAMVVFPVSVSAQKAAQPTAISGGVRVLGDDELRSTTGATMGMKCDSAWTTCTGAQLGCILVPGACQWIYGIYEYKFCVTRAPSDQCDNGVDLPCCLKRYCTPINGHCNEPEYYACTDANCDPGMECSKRFHGCEARLIQAG